MNIIGLLTRKLLFLLLSIIFVFGFDFIVFSQDEISNAMISQAEKLIGLQFSEVECDSMKDELKDNLKNYRVIREMDIPNDNPVAFLFNPIPVGFELKRKQESIKWSEPEHPAMPDVLEQLAFYSIQELAELIQAGKVTSTQLTEMYLQRLKKYDSLLHCVITFTEDLALKQAHKADKEIAAGQYRGLLHGIPYGVKDLFAMKGYKTTWGATPFKDQYIDETATVIQKLEEAGAVLIAKLSLGALAWGDVWYGNQTRNPWNLEQGSSGSSAGSASATAAGLVAFAIGSETWGSIVSPSNRCGTSGLRPTFGRVSRHGAMALSWTMDKIGPICRSVEDCAIVFNTIRGRDELDQTVLDLPFNYNPDIDLSTLKIGYLEDEFEKDTINTINNGVTLNKLRELGADLIPIDLPEMPIYALSFILAAEAAAAFDDLTRSGKDSLLVRQIKNAWPNVFRASRFIPAVEYIQANRLRYQLVQKMAKIMKEIDVFLAPSLGTNLLLTNLTGHPCVVVPNGFNEQDNPTSVSFIGQLYEEGTLCAVAKTYQDATEFHHKHPSLFQ